MTDDTKPAELQDPVACSNTYACTCPKHYAAPQAPHPAGPQDMAVYQAIADNYTAPQPAGRALTDEEIDELMLSIGLVLADDQDARMANHAGWERNQRRKIARAIERAHGIKSEGE